MKTKREHIRKPKKKVKRQVSMVFPVFEDDEATERLARRLNETKDAKRQNELLTESIDQDQIMNKERLRWYVETYAVGNKEIRSILKREIFAKYADLKFAIERATSWRTINACLDLSKNLSSRCILQALLSLTSTFGLNEYKIINRVVSSGNLKGIDKIIELCIEKSIATLESVSSTSRLLTMSAMTLVNMLSIEEKTTISICVNSSLLSPSTSFNSLLRFAFPRIDLSKFDSSDDSNNNNDEMATLALCRALCSSSTSASLLHYWKILHSGIASPQDEIRWYALTSVTILLKRARSVSTHTHVKIIAVELVPHLLRNWEHPNRSVVNLIRPLFRLIISMNVLDVSSLFNSILRLPVSSRGKYAALHILIQHQDHTITPTLSLANEMLEAIRHMSNVAQSASALFVNLIEQSSSTTSWWTEPVMTALVHQDIITRSRTALYLLPKLFKSRKIDATTALMTSLQRQTELLHNERWLWAVCALLTEVRKSTKCTIQDFIQTYTSEKNDSFLRDALVHTHEEVRSVALSAVMMVGNQEEIDLVRYFLCNEGLRTNDPKYRDTVSYHFSRFFSRVRKDTTFLSFLVRHLEQHELYPGSPFSRSALGIRLLHDVQTVCPNFRFPENVLNVVMYHMFSRFNDNRHESFQFIMTEIDRGRTISSKMWSRRAKRAIESTKLYVSEGGSLALRVLVRMSHDATTEVEKMLRTIRDLMREESSRGKLQGHLQSLRAMLRELKKESISKDLSDSLLEIGDQALKLSLTEVTSENSSVIAKADMSLDDEQRHVVAAWLTTKEASNLLADVIVVFDRVDRANQVVELLVHTLLNARHQGAVSKAAEALETVSTYLMSTSSQSCCRELPSKWLDKMFEYLNAQDTNPKLRRSSGFGAAVRALVRSCSEMCRRCFDTLIRTSGAETNPILVRVHALNLLNTLLRDTRVFVSQDHLSKLFQISVVGFEHNTWALRNSSLLVYSAVMAKMFKDHTRGAIPVSTFMGRFPGLLSFLVERLKSLLREERKKHMSIMPLLLLMSNLVPDKDNVAIEQRKQLLNMLQHLVVCKPQSIRNVAARAFVTFMRESDLITAACTCLSCVGNINRRASSQIRLNDLHGALVLTTQLFRVGSSICMERKNMENLCEILCNFILKSDLEMIVGTCLSQLFILLREVYVAKSSSSRRLWNAVSGCVFNWIKNTTLRREREIDVGISNALQNATSFMWLVSKNDQMHVDQLVSLLCESKICNETFFVTSASLLPREILSEKHVRLLGNFLSKIHEPSKQENSYHVAVLHLLASLNDSKTLNLKQLLEISKRCRRFASKNAVLKLLSLGIVRDGIDTLLLEQHSVLLDWIEMLDQYSRDDAALELRSGVLDALDKSSCLDILFKYADESDKIACILMRIWQISHRLLMDDDESVRHRMAIIMSRALKFRFTKNPLLCARLALERMCSLVSSHAKSQLMLTDTFVDWFCSGITPYLSRSNSDERLFEDEPLNENYETLWHVRHANVSVADLRVRKVLDEFKGNSLPSLVKKDLNSGDLIRGDIYCALYASVSLGTFLNGAFSEWFLQSS